MRTINKVFLLLSQSGSIAVFFVINGHAVIHKLKQGVKF